jgi:quercetin dioxygenase-like cupin family protein
MPADTHPNSAPPATSGECKAMVLRPDKLPWIMPAAPTVELVTRRLGSKQMLNGITIIKPKSSIPLHYHDCEESVIVLQGSARFELAGEQHMVGVRDTIWIPAGTPHRAFNESDREDLAVFWTYPSVSATRTLCATGETIQICPPG